MAEIRVYAAAELDQEAWRELQGISREAFSTTLADTRTLAEIDTLIAWNEPAAFYTSHVDPNSQVGGRFNADQSYSEPRVAVATEANQPVGFAYSANNVSGASERIRRAKELSVVKNYLWLREVAVTCDSQEQGIARELSRALLKSAKPLQPPATYIWPDEIGFLQAKLERVGFVTTDEKEVAVFGEASTPTRQVRMQAKSARALLSRL
ncbi:MAG TPA: hypothetical protein VLG16_02275 [Candidatus Saccharimonadales bacterium]|nr:hypothetical protein [Candidatus Saccharimonadales bacterium]